MNAYQERLDAMVFSQLRPCEVTDKRLLAAMGRLPRERFVPEALCGFAYIDEDIEVVGASERSAARFLLAPLVQARLIQLAEITAQDTLLDVGCATGYSAAILARLAARVVAVEPEPALAETARRNLKAIGANAVEVVETAFQDPPKGKGPFDAIVIEGSTPVVPETLLRQLKEGGRLIAVITDKPNQRWGRACVFLRIDGEARGVPHFDASAAPLPGFSPEQAFAF